MKIIIKILILFSLFILSSSCKIKDNREKVILFYNQKYLSINKQKKEIYNYLNYFFYKNYYNVIKIKVNSYSSFNGALEAAVKRYKKGIIFLDNFLFPLVIIRPEIFNNTNFKIITYDIDLTQLQKDQVITKIFNININNNILFEEIIKLLKKESNNKSLSDCGIVYSINSTLAIQFIDYIKMRGYKVNLFSGSDDISLLYDWLNINNNLKVVLLFGNKLNSILFDYENKNNFKFIEVFTNYGKYNNSSLYNIQINWYNIIIESLNSKDFKKFINYKDKSNIIILQQLSGNNNISIIYNPIIKLKEIKLFLINYLKKILKIK